MKGAAIVGALAFGCDIAFASNRTNCYETAPSNQYYSLDWKAEGHTFFDDLDFRGGPGATKGCATYAGSKAEALSLGTINTTAHHAYMMVGKTLGNNRRHSVKVETRKTWKHFLGVLRYKHVPFGLGIWPAFWMNAPGVSWPNGGELDILEYASHDGQKVSLHTRDTNKCKLDSGEVNKCTEMPDSNKMDYDCYTDYDKGRLGCGPTTFAGQRQPEYWSNNPGAMAIEWTDRFIKVFYFDEANIPDDLDVDFPRPESWDEKWVIAYFPFAASNEKNPGWCPNPADVLMKQKIILNIELCGTWAGNGATWVIKDQDPFAQEWVGKRDRGECQNGEDCCSKYLAQSKMDKYLEKNAYFDIMYLKIFKLKTGADPVPPPSRRRRRSVPAPSPGTCAKTWYEDKDCFGAEDIGNTGMDTANNCCELCGNTTDCYSFTHNAFDGHMSPTCYLKGKCTESMLQGKRGCTSGTVEKAPTPPPPPTPPGACGSYLQNTDCSGGADLKNMAMDSVDDCCAECSQTDGCTAFTHTGSGDGHGMPYCYLKKSCKKSERSVAMGAKSGHDIAPDPSAPRRRRRAPASKGCCSWAANNECGSSTDYCVANADNCVVCGGHWVTKALFEERESETMI